MKEVEGVVRNVDPVSDPVRTPQVAPSMVDRVARAIASEDGVGSPLGFMPDGRAMRDATWDVFMPEQHGIWRRMALAAIEAIGGWQPIDTAPGDGRLALVYRPLAVASGDMPVTIKRLVGGNNFVWEHTVPPGQKPTNPTDGSCHATHWMPLPDAPDGATSRHTPQANDAERSE